MESSRGYVIIACSESEELAAETLAMSLKIKNPTANVAIGVKSLKKLSINEESAFDVIIELPFNKQRTYDESIWQAYWLSPYEETIVIHPYTIVGENFESQWDYLNKAHELCFSNTTTDFKSMPQWDAEDSYYVEENVNHLRSNMFYFKKTDTALEFFKLLDVYLQYWKIIYDKMLKPEHTPDDLDLDLIMSMVAKTLDIDNLIPQNNKILQTINTDKLTYDLIEEEKIEKVFSEYLNIWVRNDSNLKIHNFIVSGTLFYNSNLFLTEEIYDNYGTKYRENKYKKELVG